MSLLAKLIFIGFLIYLALRAVAGLFRAVWTDPQAPRPIQSTPPPPSAQSPRPGPAPRPAARKQGADIEDAQWVDLG